MSKVPVNGPDTCEVFRWQRSHSQLYDEKEKLSKQIPWNYAKFLIDGSTGRVIKYVTPVEDPQELESALNKLLMPRKDRDQLEKLERNGMEAQGSELLA